jgi:hypothetical protein
MLNIDQFSSVLILWRCYGWALSNEHLMVEECRKRGSSCSAAGVSKWPAQSHIRIANSKFGCLKIDWLRHTLVFIRPPPLVPEQVSIRQVTGKHIIASVSSALALHHNSSVDVLEACLAFVRLCPNGDNCYLPLQMFFCIFSLGTS